MSANVPITFAHGDGIGPPDGISETLLTDAYGCRFTAKDGGATSKKTVALLGRVLEQGLESVKTETLRTYDGAAGYALSQGQ